MCGSWCPFWFSNHLAEEKRAGCTLVVMWLSVCVLFLFLAVPWVDLWSVWNFLIILLFVLYRLK